MNKITVLNALSHLQNLKFALGHLDIDFIPYIPVASYPESGYLLLTYHEMISDLISIEEIDRLLKDIDSLMEYRKPELNKKYGF